MRERRTLVVEDHLPQQWRFGLVWRGLDEPGLWSTAALAWLTVSVVVFLKTAVARFAGAMSAQLIALGFAALAAACLIYACSRMRSTVAVELDHERLRVLDWSGRIGLSIERHAIAGVALHPVSASRYSIVITLDCGARLYLPFGTDVELGMALGNHLWNALQELRVPQGYRH